MRVLHIIGTVNPESGGPAEAVRMLVEFAPAGVESEVVTVDAPGAAYLAGYACAVHAVGPAMNRYGYSPRLTEWLRDNRARFDGVIVHGLWSYSGLAALSEIAGEKPYVVFAHGMLDPYFKRAFPLKHVKKWVYWLLAEYWLLRRARRVMFTTGVERDLAQRSFWLWRWKAMVAPLGADAAAVATPDGPEAFLGVCRALRSKRFLLFLGRIHAKKGCDLLVRAFTQCADMDDDVHLVMAGPNSSAWKAKLQQMAVSAGLGDRVHWPGMLTGAPKAGAFELCEAFVLPSHQENFGIAVVEALAAGRPVLLSNKVNIAPEIAADGCGFVDEDTVRGTTRLMERWMRLTEVERATMRAQALRTFAERYDIRQNAAAVLRVFDAV